MGGMDRSRARGRREEGKRGGQKKEKWRKYKPTIQHKILLTPRFIKKKKKKKKKKKIGKGDNEGTK